MGFSFRKKQQICLLHDKAALLDRHNAGTELSDRIQRHGRPTKRARARDANTQSMYSIEADDGGRASGPLSSTLSGGCIWLM